MLPSLVIKRGISTTAVCNGKRNFRKFQLINKRGTTIFKKQQSVKEDPQIPIDHRGARPIGYMEPEKFEVISEMVPELIVPDLTDFKLKPYVSYRAPDIVQSTFTAQDLFSVVYAPKIEKDYKDGRLKEDLSPIEPTLEEQMTPEEAIKKAQRTGSDLF